MYQFVSTTLMRNSMRLMENLLKFFNKDSSHNNTTILLSITLLFISGAWIFPTPITIFSEEVTVTSKLAGTTVYDVLALPASLLLIVTSYYPHHAKLQTSVSSKLQAGHQMEILFACIVLLGPHAINCITGFVELIIIGHNINIFPKGSHQK